MTKEELRAIEERTKKANEDRKLYCICRAPILQDIPNLLNYVRELHEKLGMALNSLEEHNREYHYNTSNEVIAELRERFGITDTEQKLPGEYA